MDLNKFASGTYAAKWKNWGVNLLQRRQIPHLPRYLHSLLFGMQMWHLPSLPPYLLHGFTFLRHVCKEKICANPFFCPVRDSTPTWRRRRNLNPDHIRWEAGECCHSCAIHVYEKSQGGLKIYCRAPVWNPFPGYELPAIYRGVLSRDFLYKSRDKTSSNISQ